MRYKMKKKNTYQKLYVAYILRVCFREMGYKASMSIWYLAIGSVVYCKPCPINLSAIGWGVYLGRVAIQMLKPIDMLAWRFGLLLWFLISVILKLSFSYKWIQQVCLSWCIIGCFQCTATWTKWKQEILMECI